MTNDALFMPNGTWITGEMAGALETLENEFAWGMAAVPAAGTAPYSFCWFEQAWIPAGAMQPILGILLVGIICLLTALFVYNAPYRK